MLSRCRDEKKSFFFLQTFNPPEPFVKIKGRAGLPEDCWLDPNLSNFPYIGSLYPPSPGKTATSPIRTANHGAPFGSLANQSTPFGSLANQDRVFGFQPMGGETGSRRPICGQRLMKGEMVSTKWLKGNKTEQFTSFYLI